MKKLGGSQYKRSCPHSPFNKPIPRSTIRSEMAQALHKSPHILQYCMLWWKIGARLLFLPISYRGSRMFNLQLFAAPATSQANDKCWFSSRETASSVSFARGPILEWNSLEGRSWTLVSWCRFMRCDSGTTKCECAGTLETTKNR